MWILLGLFVGCGAEKEPPPSTTDTVSSTTDTTTTTTTIPTETTGDTASVTTVQPFDCDTVPSPPFSSSMVEGARGYHGLVFTDDGHLIGADGITNNASLISTDSTGNWSVFRPNIGYTEQLDRLSDGTIIALVDSSVVRISDLGEVTVISSLTGEVYGMRVGPDDMIYTLNFDKIHRIDPFSGDKSEWLDPPWAPKVMEFNAQGTKAFIGTAENDGKVWMVELDAQFNITTTPVVHAQTPGSWHDGLTMDVCGYVYLAEYDDRAMYRISPSGVVEDIYVLTYDVAHHYGHGAEFGVGAGGFDVNVLYAPNPFTDQLVSQIDVGVPGRGYTGPVINAH